ncbi:hypothetical protein BH09MYX1_BH09MYX1_24890 [soil metagenome]
MTSERKTSGGMSLRLKWTLAVLAASLVPMLLVSIAGARIERRSLERAEADLQLAVVDEVSETLYRSLGEAETATTDVGRLVSDARIPEDTRLTLAQERLGREYTLDAVGVYTESGEYAGGIVREGKTDAGLPKTFPNDWAEATWRVSDHDLYFVSAILDGASHERHGWVIGKLARGSLSSEVALLSRARFATDDKILVVDKSYEVLAGPESGPTAVGTSLRGRDVFAELHGDALWTGVATFRTFYDESGETLVGTTRTIPDRGWAIVVRSPEADALPELAALRRGIAIAIAVVGALAILVGAWLAARTTRPVESLVELTRAYGRREFLKRSTVRTGDELEELGDAMTTMAVSLASSETEIKRRAEVEAGLARYLPREVAERVAAGDANEVALGGDRRYVAVLFADVASFTSFAEGTSPEEAVKLLNQLFSLLSELGFRHDGMVDKFMGDCVMAVFGARGRANDEVAIKRAALAAAEDMHRFVEAANVEWKANFAFDVRLGIGVASGDVLLGNLGGESRMEFTAIGDVVNVAARLESAAQPGTTLCIADTKVGLDDLEFQSMGMQAIRGKQKQVEVFRVIE